MNVATPDFDVLLSMHQKDPKGFDQFRRALLRSAVDAAPAAYRPSLERLLVRIEAARERASTPTDAALVAFGMMQDSVTQLQDGWEQALDAMAGLHAALLIERVRH